jgi:Icc-related predicted phosphoesterase
MKVILISDTHNLHADLELPEGDLLIHAGDLSAGGTASEIRNFLDWFSSQPHPNKVLIAGNHDFYLEKLSAEELQAFIPSNIHYLNNELLELEGLKIWGSPVSPISKKRWAFNRLRGNDIQEVWDMIPNNLDILITHGPPLGILDEILDGRLVGCENLRDTIFQKQPKLVCFGHIHEARGLEKQQDIQFVNASSVDRYSTKVFPPYIFEYIDGSFHLYKK